MLSKAKHLFFLLLTLSMFSSCISIEKRKYRDGYCVEWFSKVKKIEQDTSKKCIKKSSCVLSLNVKEKISDPIANVCSIEKNILIEKHKIKDVETVYRNLIPVTERKYIKPKYKRATEDGYGIYVFITLLLVGGAVLMLIYSSPLWIVLAGFLALLIGLLSIVGTEPDHKVTDNEETMEEKLSVKKKIPFIAFLSLLLALVTIGSYLFYPGITIFISILGSAFSADAIYKIKKDRIHKKGMGIAITSFVINMVSLAFLAYALLMYIK